ncbi:hypothetical protein [Sphingomonas solaris]|uniref:Right-handed parallel beta-helix repeat-containing protein n=1 Tax=Alterirhizorhabdus solaris TaxID=2529389 RepID=A0A558R833_9SPHN|nr:hypothetical protein [Sphingomonas solaris]TVV75540.1 hypothetical protein FOY91_06670 [Sphingomonas solaris]
MAVILPTPGLAFEQIHTSPVELVDSTPATPGIVISKAVLVPPVAKGKSVKSCGKAGALWAYVLLTDECPAAALATAAPVSLRPVVNPAPPRDVTGTITKTAANIGSGGRISNASVAGMSVLSRTKARVIDGYTFEDLNLTGSTFIYRAFTYQDGITNPVFRRIRSIGGGAGGILLRKNIGEALIEDVRIEADPTKPNTSPGDVPEGISLCCRGDADTGHAVLRRVWVQGIRHEPKGGGFRNGDGLLVANHFSADVTDSYFGWNSDAGVDLKPATVRVDRVILEGNRRGMKAWSSQSHGLVWFKDNGQPGSGAAADLQVQGDAGKRNRVTFDTLVVERTQGATYPVVQVENGQADVYATRCLFIGVPKGTPLIVAAGKAKGSTFSGGPGCAL